MTLRVPTARCTCPAADCTADCPGAQVAEARYRPVTSTGQISDVCWFTFQPMKAATYFRLEEQPVHARLLAALCALGITAVPLAAQSQNPQAPPITVGG